MQKTKHGRVALITASLAILGSLGIASMTAPNTGSNYKAFDALVGSWEGDASVFIAAGLPPTVSKAHITSEKIGSLWVSSRLATTFMDKPYTELMLLGYDQAHGSVTGSIFSSGDPVARVVTGDFNPRLMTWTLHHETLNSMGIAVPGKTVISVDGRTKTRRTQRFHVMDGGFEVPVFDVTSAHPTR